MRLVLSLFGLAIFLSLPAFGQVDLSRGLLAYYPFNGTAADVSGHGNNGALFNGVQPTTDRQGRPNSAYLFDGVDDYIQIPGANNLNPSGALSIALFFSPARSGQQTLLGKIDNTNGVGSQFRMGMDFSSYSGVLFGVYPVTNGCAVPPSNGAYVNTGSPLVKDQWYCLVGTFENGVQKIYLNGVLVQSKTAAWSVLNQCPNAGIQIGRWWSGDLQAFQGKIDELRIYDRAINQDEVNALCSCSISADFAFVQAPCNPLQVRLNSVVIPGTSYSWNIEGTDYTPTDPSDAGLAYTFPSFATYPITLKLNNGGCSGSITKAIPIYRQPADILHKKDTTICAGDTVHLSAQPGLDFCWQPADYLSDPSSANPIAQPPVTTKYYFTSRMPENNLIVNGDFSGGNTGFTSDYAYSSSGISSSVYFVGNDPHAWNSNMSYCTDHGGNDKMLLVNGSQQLNVKIWSETVTVRPNTNYAFSTWLQSLASVGPAILRLYINGQPIGPLLQADATTCVWRQFYDVWNSGASTSAVVSIINMNQQNSGNDFALDDISFSAISMLTDSITITVENPAIKAWPDTTVCPGSPVALRAQGAGSYTWWPADGLSNPGIGNPIAAPSVPTKYIVTSTTPRGCMAKDSITIGFFPVPAIHITPDTVVCLGDAVRLHVSGGSRYSWSPAALLDDPASTMPMLTTGADTLYRVSILDANQCTEKDSVAVKFRRKPVFTRPSGVTVCEGASGILGSNDDTHYVYAWEPATFLDDPSSPKPRVSPTSSLQYTVAISDSVCPHYDSSFMVGARMISTPEVTAYKAHDIDCAQPTTELNVTGAATYSWEPAIGLNNPDCANPTVSIDTTTTYTVKGTDRWGCIAYSNITVNVKATGKDLFILPNAFTPNGDGHNDCFGVKRWGDVTLEDFSIFSRRGMQVFTTQDPSQCWDGNFHGQPQPADTYIYVIRAKTFCGVISRRGTVTLVR
ncbi:MAG TPA: LamG-like jellyroll fold domain-containing protein [Puia sp.]|nr:LamG-like jellyroll fold domain-containing protein [Puia sp.]